MPALSRIVLARATPVIVPARPDSINSPAIDDDDPEFARKYRSGSQWTDFPLQVKYIVELTAADGTTGIGETYRSAGAGAVREALSAVVGADVLALDWRHLPVADARVYDAIESAVLDLAGRLLGVPVCQLLGGRFRDRVDCSGWTGRRTPEEAARKAAEALARGHRVFKFKCSDHDPVAAWIEAIHARCGTAIRVLLDPNERWHDVATARRMMEGVRRECMFALEDPIDRRDYAGYHTLRKSAGIPLFMHISIPYAHQGQRAADLLHALRHDSADGFNFNGSMFAFVTLAELAELAGKPVWHGSEVDLGILEVSALHAAAAARACTLPCDLLGELVRQDDLIEPGIAFADGWAQVPAGPGLGVELDRQAVARFQAGDPMELSADGIEA